MSISTLAQAAQVIGDQARAAMLVELMDGRALTSGELAQVAGVAPSTASGHLSVLLSAGLLVVIQQGRHRYYRIATPAIGGMIETMMGVTALTTAQGARRQVLTGPRDEAMRLARTCYDHLAGKVAVSIVDAMAQKGRLVLDAEGAVLTQSGIEFLSSIGADVEHAAGHPGASSFVRSCRPCLDWSERRPHIGGAVGATIYQAFLAQGWMHAGKKSRAVTITPRGKAALLDRFGVDCSSLPL